MTYIVTNKFKNHVVEQLGESIIEPANNVYYLMAGRSMPYPDGDDVIVAPTNSVKDGFVDPYELGIFAKKINQGDAFRVTRRVNWTANTLYAAYDDLDGNLFNKDFYVSRFDGSTYFVYKCLDNNNGARSVNAPTDNNESLPKFETSDGYVWKLIYKLPQNQFEKFATEDYQPVTTSANVAGNNVPGALDVVKIISPGSSYVATLTGQFNLDDLRDSIPNIAGDAFTYRLPPSASSNTNFYTDSALYITGGPGAGQLRKITQYNISGNTKYVTIGDTPFTTPPGPGSTYLIAPYVTFRGDGTSQATGYANVASNSTVTGFINKVNIVDRGAGYTYSTAVISGNTGGVANAAVIRPIIPPKGGHGADSQIELGADSFAISVNFFGDESGAIPIDNDYRSLYVLTDPLINNVRLNLSNNNGTFLSTENVCQVQARTLTGVVSFTSTNTTITGLQTDFNVSLNVGDTILLFDPINSNRCLRTVSGIANATSLTTNTAPNFDSTVGVASFAEVTARGKRISSDISSVTLSNTEPKFYVGKYVLGESSGAWGKISSITINDKPYNLWNFLDNRTKLSYTSINGTLSEDSIVYQVDPSISNAYFHSSDGSYIYLTKVRGTINPDPLDPLTVLGDTATIDLDTTKYNSDIVKGTGEVFYIENVMPISRDGSQTETIKIILNF